jgi:hypothetical protein
METTQYYKIEERLVGSKKHIDISSHIESIMGIILEVDELVRERNLTKLKEKVYELHQKDCEKDSEKDLSNKHLIWCEEICKRVSYTGWGIPSNMERSEEEKLFSECVFWRNEYIETLIKSM